MNIVYLHQYFKTDSGGTRSYEFSKYLIDKGHSITMITGNDLQKKQIEGINIKSTRTSYSNNYSFTKRILSFIHFMIKSTIIGLREKQMDVIYATSTPLTIGVPAIIIAKLKRKPFIFEVRDVWPDIPIELGYIKNPILKKILLSF